jgi:hypothetical protein
LVIQVRVSLDVDQSGWTGDIEADAALLASLKGGRIVGVNASGKVALADGALAGVVQPLGFLIVDAAGYFYENKPALASGKVAITHGNCVVITDQLKSGVTFAAGDLVYCGTGADVGMVVKTVATGATPIGVALTAASGAGAELTIAVSR